MKIGFDFRPALRNNSRNRGIGRYTFELASALLETDSAHEFLLYLNQEEAPLPAGRYLTRQVTSLNRPSRLNWLVDLLLLPHIIKRDRVDLFHATEMISFTPPRKCPVWSTVHDLIPYIFWEETVEQVPRDYAYALKRFWRQVPKADRIITTSNHSKADICEMMGVDPERVSVVHLGVSDRLELVDEGHARSLIRRKFDLERRFLFYVGGSDFRKNLGVLLEAFAQIRVRGYDGMLVLAGETFLWDIPEVKGLKELAHGLGLENSVLFPGYLLDEDLSCFYSACDFFVFPSLYEGFGLPVLEAMKCGAPLLVSNCSSVPEVAEDAGFYFNPKLSENLIEVFWEAFEDREEVQARRDIGLERASRFTWSAAAGIIHGLYDRYRT